MNSSRAVGRRRRGGRAGGGASGKGAGIVPAPSPVSATSPAGTAGSRVVIAAQAALPRVLPRLGGSVARRRQAVGPDLRRARYHTCQSPPAVVEKPPR